jgi:hypothetical protein
MRRTNRTRLFDPQKHLSAIGNLHNRRARLRRTIGDPDPLIAPHDMWAEHCSDPLHRQQGIAQRQSGRSHQEVHE